MCLPRACAVTVLIFLAASDVVPATVQPATPLVWPHIIIKGRAGVSVYQPQVVWWPDQKILTARAAIAITPAGARFR